MRTAGTLAFLLMLGSLNAGAMDLPQYMEAVTQKHRGLEALRRSREAADDRAVGVDIDLTPALTLQSAYLSDKKQPNMMGANETVVQEVSLGLGKKFSSGTAVNLAAKTGGYENRNLANPLFQPFAEYGQGGLTLQVSQSLWKNAFGRSTRLRTERTESTTAAEVGGYDLQARQILAEAEAAFWERLYLQEELKVRKSSLDRAKKLETWIKRRTQDGIADRADLLNVQALSASRSLQLAMTEDEVIANERKVRDLLEMDGGETVPVFLGSIGQLRAPRALVPGDGEIVRLDAWLAGLESKAREVGAREAEEALKADLTLAGTYATNSFELGGDAAAAAGKITRTDTPTAQVALTWTYLFESDAKVSTRNNARKEASAAKLRSDRKILESRTAWTEMLRRHQELGRKIKSAEEILKIQTARAKAEQDKYSKGRTITSNVITSEQDAAEAELQWIRLSVEQRKLEAQTRMFIAVKE